MTVPAYCQHVLGMIAMVSYQRWTSIAFDVAKQQGADLGTEQTNVISVAADVWNDRKSELSTATIAEARSIAENEITVA